MRHLKVSGGRGMRVQGTQKKTGIWSPRMHARLVMESVELGDVL